MRGTTLCTRLLSLVVVALCLTQLECYNVLVTVVASAASQTLPMYSLADLLGSRGHNVTLLRHTMWDNVKNPTLKYATELETHLFEGEDKERVEAIREHAYSWQWTKSKGPPKVGGKGQEAALMQVRGCERMLHDEQLMGRLRDANFDVIVIWAYDFCTFGLTRVLGVDAYAWMSTAYFIDVLAYHAGAPMPDAVTRPRGMSTVTTDLSFVQRATNMIYRYIPLAAFELFLFPKYTEIFRKVYGADFPDLRDVMTETQLYLVKGEPLMEYPQPFQHNVVFIPGYDMEAAEPLDGALQLLVDNALPGGVVLFSFGSYAADEFMPQHIKMAFLNAFKRFPKHTFLYRSSGFPEADGVPNVKILPWLPLKDLFPLEKTRAFVGHAGGQIGQEALIAGVPCVMIPLFGDLYLIASRMISLGAAVSVYRDNITEASIFEALSAVLDDDRMLQNAQRVARMIKKKPVSGTDLAVRWVEYLAEYKNLDMLKPDARHLGLIQYYSLDVYALAIGVVIVFTFLLLKCCCLCCRCAGRCCTRKSKRD